MRFLKLFLLGCLVSGCAKRSNNNVFQDTKLYSKTVYALNSVVMGNNFTPVVATRNYVYANIAAYEVVAASEPEHYRSLVGQLTGFNNVAQPLAGKKINCQYAAILAFCNVGGSVTFPEGSMKTYIDSLHRLAISSGIPDDVINNSEEYARRVTKSIIDWSKGDNYARLRSAPKFAVIDSPGRWIPTPPAYASAVEPHWSEIRPMVIKLNDQMAVPKPLKYDIKNKSSAYFKEMMLLKNASDGLSPEQIQIADFWDDNPGKLNVTGHVMFVTKKFSPPGHWMSITGIAAENAHVDFNTAVYAYTKTSIALFDAFIECWNAKYTYKTVRPETVINKYIDDQWRPHLQTPPFPEYTCGHSTISASAAEVLTSVFGDHFAYKDTSELEFGIKSRFFSSFRNAAAENVKARFYGGIHFHRSCVIGADYGKVVGDLIVARLQMKK